MADKRDSSLIHIARGDKAPPQREFWSSRNAFYCATAGAMIGFGNVWRFPGLSVQYGGGAFFIPYLVGIILIGFPLTVLEIGFGQYFQTGDIGVFGGFHPRLRGVGVCSLACSVILSSYYIVLIAWVVKTFVSTWDDDAPWAKPGITGDEAIRYFRSNIVGMDTVTNSDLLPTRIVGENVGYNALIWFIIFIATSFGLRNIGRITCVTMGLPFLLLFVFLGRAATLPGAREGVTAYIGIWDLSVLKNETEVWAVAVTQVFFSTGCTLGILTSYGSHCKRNEPVVFNSCVVLGLNSMYSIITGFAIFCALGHLAHLEGVTVTDLPYSGFSLIFGTWPVVLGTLPGGIHWVRLLFLNLFLLGIDSAFSFVETYVTILQDTVIFRDTSRRTLIIGCIALNFSFGILYCTDSGLNFLNIIDFYLNFVMLLIGFLEAFGAAWAYGIDDLYKSVGVKATISYMMSNFIPLLIGIGFWSRKEKYGFYAGFVATISGWSFGLLVTHCLLMQRMARQPGRWTLRSIWYECAFGNIGRLRDQIQPCIGPIPFIWMILTKNFVPHTCIMLFFELFTSPTFGAGSYEGYAIRPYQLLGLLCFIFITFLFIIGLIIPEVYEPLALPLTKVVLQGVSEHEERETDDIESSERASLPSIIDQNGDDEI